MGSRRRAYALLALLLVAGAVLVVLGRHPSPSRSTKAQAPGSYAAPVPPALAAARDARALPASLAGPVATRSFTDRLRCSNYHFFLPRDTPRDVLELLCQGHGRRALALLTPLLEAGDPKAFALVAFLGNGGQCDEQPPPAHHERMMDLARRRGASDQTLRRLDALLAREDRGFDADRLATCRQSNAELAQARPRMLPQLVAALGRPVELLRGEDADDVEIEYERSTLAPGDAEGKVQLADRLLQKKTADSQAEAMTLLRQAAQSSARAQTDLARCLIDGCPTPAPDGSEARALLQQAASQGDLLALMMLAGPPFESARDWLPELPAPERYAWGQFMEQLNEEGCFGAAQYASWALSPPRTSPLRSLSPADAQEARARADALATEKLGAIRAALGCQ